MEKDQGIGVAMLIGSIVGIIIYIWLIISWPLIVLQITASLALAVLLGILAWVGWTMARTPPPTPIEPESVPSPSTETKPESPSTETKPET